MKPKVILTALAIFLVVGGFIKLSIDNARLKKEIANLILELSDHSEIRTVSFTIREVTGSFDKKSEMPTPFILEPSESEILLREFESNKELQISAFPQTSVPSGRDATFELSGLRLRASPEVGADGSRPTLSISAKSEGQKTTSLANLSIWTGQTVVMTSPRNSNSLLFLQARIQP